MNAPSELHELLVDIARRENAHIADVLAARNGRADEIERLQAENAQLRQRCTTAEARLAEIVYEAEQYYDGAEDSHFLHSVLGDLVRIAKGGPR